MKVCINGQKPLKIFFSRTRKPMILKLGMKHQAIELYKVYISHGPGVTLTFLRQSQLRLPTHLNGENCYNVI